MSEMYFKDWNEATEFMKENPADGVDVGDMKIVNSSVLIAMVTDMSLLSRMVLGDLTGQELDTNEQLYDYLAKTIVLDDKKVMEYGLVVVAQHSGLGDVLSMINPVSEGK